MGTPRSQTSLVLLVLFSLALSACSSGSSAPRVRTGTLTPAIDDDTRELAPLVERAFALRGQVPGTERRGIVILDHTVDLEGTRFAFVRSESRWMTAFDVDASGVSEQRIALGTATLRAANAWRARANGAIERSGLDDFTVVRDSTGNTHARVRFAEIEPGDVFGWSITTRESSGRAHVREPLCFDHYVVRGRLIVDGDNLLTHRVATRNSRQVDVNVEITERHRGFPQRTVVTYADLPPRRPGAFSPPPLLTEPHVEITRLGRFYQELDAWMLDNDWDLWIALELGQPQTWIERSPALRELALEITATSSTDREAADQLHRYVRDTIRTLDAGVREHLFADAAAANNLDLAEMLRELDEEADSPLAQRFRDAQQLPPVLSKVSNPTRLRPTRTSTAVVLSGEGTRLEKTVLLASLFAALHLEQRIGFARDREFGPIDHQSTGAWQFTDAFVVLLTPDLRPDLWYCVTREGLPPGVLPVSLQSVPMLSVADGFEARLASLWERARAAAGGQVELRVPEWTRTIRAANWAVWSRTPGDPLAPCAVLEEVVLWNATLDAAQCTVRSKGEIGIDAHSYVSERFPTARLVGTMVYTAPTPDSIDEHRVQAELDLGSLPAAGAGVWTLSGPMFFGVSPLAAWQREREVFHVDRTTDFTWRVEIPLPEGFTSIEAVPEFRTAHDRLAYVMQIRAEGGRLVIERRLRLIAGTSPNHELSDPIANIRLLESGWLVVRAAASSR